MDRPQDRERAIKIMFEEFGVPTFTLQNSAVLALAAVGKTTGIVLDCGYFKNYVGVVIDGKLVDYTTQRLDIGGEVLNE